MKKMIKLLLWIFLFGILTTANAQESQMKRGGVFPGYVITLQGDTLKGYVLNINLWMNQFVTYFYKDSADVNGRVKYKPNDIKGYQVGSRFYESVKYPFIYSTHKQNFVLRKLQGAICLYVWYFDEDRSKLLSTSISLADLASAFLLIEDKLWKSEFGMKSDGKLTDLGSLKFIFKFEKNMSAYVADDAELAEKILKKTKGYQNIDVEKILREYNERKQK